MNFDENEPQSVREERFATERAGRRAARKAASLDLRGARRRGHRGHRRGPPQLVRQSGRSEHRQRSLSALVRRSPRMGLCRRGPWPARASTRVQGRLRMGQRILRAKERKALARLVRRLRRCRESGGIREHMHVRLSAMSGCSRPTAMAVRCPTSRTSCPWTAWSTCWTRPDSSSPRDWNRSPVDS